MWKFKNFSTSKIVIKIALFGGWKILKFPHCGPPTFLVKAFLFKMKLKVFVNADQTSFGTLEDRIVLTVWKFQDFSVNNIFREITFMVHWKCQKNDIIWKYKHLLGKKFLKFSHCESAPVVKFLKWILGKFHTTIVKLSVQRFDGKIAITLPLFCHLLGRFHFWK